MKTADIKVGKFYRDDKGSVRKVIGAGPQFTTVSWQADTDCVRYVLVAKKRGPNRIGSEHNTTRFRFASWAKAEVKPEPEGVTS